MPFDDDFSLITGNTPFPWQRALYKRFVAGDFPRSCDLPTGLGKTSVVAIWLLALIANPRLPRRLVYVVNRRTVVDQSTVEAERLCAQLQMPEAKHLRDAVDAMAAVKYERPLAISTLRGEFADNGMWRRDPSRPAVIVGTVDMIGSRLLFSGYGCGFRSRPLHAGFLGQDALLVHDEAHLEPAFQSLLASIAAEQQRSVEPRPLKVLALSATSREEGDFTLSDADRGHPIVIQRVHARKTLQLHHLKDRKELPERIAAKAAELRGKIVVFLSSVDHAEKCAQMLRRGRPHSVVTLTGTMRGSERDGLLTDPVFGRFLNRGRGDVQVGDDSVYLVATSAGEVGIDLSADHLVTDLPPFDSLTQRLGRVNRFGAGDAEVHVFCEELRPPSREKTSSGESEEEEDEPSKRKDEYDHARYFTRETIRSLPMRGAERFDASPWALAGVSREARGRASTPQPDIHHVDSMLFDRWSYTTVTSVLPGRPAVAEWLHGKAEWEPPRTTVAWRREVAWLTSQHLGGDSLDDFLSDYPLRSRETLTDVTSRVVKHLDKLVQRDSGSALRAWVIQGGGPVEIVRLADLVGDYDSKKNPTLDGATVILPPEAGGLRAGLLDGTAAYDQAVRYDLGPRDGERVVHEAEEAPDAPVGMRLARAVRRELQADDSNVWWRLYVPSQGADDDGSRSSRRALLLDRHLRLTETWALRLSTSLGLAESEKRALVHAGRAHDLGKSRRVWQRSIKRFIDPPLAKGPMQPAELGHYRHELGSLHDADFRELSDEERDLALHVVAAHHGRARPYFPIVESYDPEVSDQRVAEIVREVPLRFDRLQQRYGRWGLAWLESVLRAADVLGSEDEEVFE